ncbi:MAG: hypothetical protein HY608_09635 [Planctomycetes bacterium]|nr:hypothetical protein [Planctomycetota bacterium]
MNRTHKWTMSWVAGLTAVSLSAFADPSPIQIRSATGTVEGGVTVRVDGQVRAPDQTTVTITITRAYPTEIGEAQRLMQLRRARVEGGAFTTTFETFAGGLPWGQYRIEAKIDPARQYPAVASALPADGFAPGDTSMEVGFQAALAPDLRAILADCAKAGGLGEELAGERAMCDTLGGGERTRHFETWQAAWSEKVAALQGECAPLQTDESMGALYARSGQALCGLIERLDYWRRHHLSELSGVPDEILVAHPNWLGDPPAEGIETVRRTIASQVAFNGMLKAREALKMLRGGGGGTPTIEARRAVAAWNQDFQTALALLDQAQVPEDARAKAAPVAQAFEALAAGAEDSALADTFADLERSVTALLDQAQAALARGR